RQSLYILEWNYRWNFLVIVIFRNGPKPSAKIFVGKIGETKSNGNDYEWISESPNAVFYSVCRCDGFCVLSIQFFTFTFQSFGARINRKFNSLFRIPRIRKRTIG